MKRATIAFKEVEHIPDVLEDGVLYVSKRFATSIHKCCCGCGEEVVTPLGTTDWSCRIVGGRVSLTPSIGNWSYKCRSHYWIRRGQVVWAGDMSEREIRAGRAKDRLAKLEYFSHVNQAKPPTEDLGRSEERQPATDRWRRLRHAVSQWLLR